MHCLQGRHVLAQAHRLPRHRPRQAQPAPQQRVRDFCSLLSLAACCQGACSTLSIEDHLTLISSCLVQVEFEKVDVQAPAAHEVGNICSLHRLTAYISACPRISSLLIRVDAPLVQVRPACPCFCLPGFVPACAATVRCRVLCFWSAPKRQPTLVGSALQPNTATPVIDGHTAAKTPKPSP